MKTETKQHTVLLYYCPMKLTVYQKLELRDIILSNNKNKIIISANIIW